MKLQDQCCTLQQAKRLKELGITQLSVACYIGDELHLFEKGLYNWAEQNKIDAVAAFTVAELGVMLPAGYDTMYTYEGWRCYDCDGQDIYEVSYGYRYEAECRAAAIIFLLENGKLKSEEVNQRLQNA